MLTAAGSGSDAFANPSTWVNFGALGLIVLALLTGYLWAKPSVDAIMRDREAERVAANTREARLISERDRALAERDAMVEVITEFTTTASAIIPILRTAARPTPRTRRGD